MKIIVPGRVLQDTVYRGKCTYCGCVVEFTEDEAATEGIANAPYVICPTAGCCEEIVGRVVLNVNEIHTDLSYRDK